VPDPRAAVAEWTFGEIVEEHLQFAGPFAGAHVAVLVEHRHSRGVVPAVFQALEATEEYLETLVVTDVAHDSAHER
jgi:hypothetical protein